MQTNERAQEAPGQRAARLRPTSERSTVFVLLAGVVMFVLGALLLPGQAAAETEKVPRRAITDIQVITGSSAGIQCPSGYTKNSQELNQGAGGDYIYLCVQYNEYPWSEGTWGLSFINVLSYTPGTQAYRHVECDDEVWGSNKRELIDVDLNKGAGGSYMYFCARYTTLPQARTGLAGFTYDIDFATSGSPLVPTVWDLDPVDDACKDQVAPIARKANGGGNDLNQFAGGEYIYTCVTDAFRMSFLDDTPPEITPQVTGTEGDAGWYVSDVEVSWAVEDPESEVTTEGCETTSLTADTAGTALTCTATSEGGDTTETVTIKRDATAPTITAAQTPEPNASGWNDADVTVAFTCEDAQSGIASCPQEQSITAEAAGQSVSGTATDKAGNTASASVDDINIDRTAPKVSCATSQTTIWPANHKLVPVTVDVKVTDALSGPNGFVLSNAESSEPDDAPGGGDGATTGDVQGFEVGTPDVEGELRAERAGRGQGRTYTLTYIAEDKAGNSSDSCQTTVTVRHDRGRR